MSCSWCSAWKLDLIASFGDHTLTVTTTEAA
jgi:hypothetical protein